jgi:hypothetical protein
MYLHHLYILHMIELALATAILLFFTLKETREKAKLAPGKKKD